MDQSWRNECTECTQADLHFKKKKRHRQGNESPKILPAGKKATMISGQLTASLWVPFKQFDTKIQSNTAEQKHHFSISSTDQLTTPQNPHKSIDCTKQIVHGCARPHICMHHGWKTSEAGVAFLWMHKVAWDQRVMTLKPKSDVWDL